MIEQRAEERVELSDATVEVIDVESGVEFQALARDVSGGGLAFRSKMEPPVGADMKVSVRGVRADLRVTRVEKQGDGFAVAGRLSRR